MTDNRSQAYREAYDRSDKISCDFWHMDGRPHVTASITGRAADAYAARAIYDYLIATCDRQAKAWVAQCSILAKKERTIYGHSKISPRREGTSYRISYAYGVGAQVAAARKEGGVGTGLIVLDQEKENLSQAKDDIWGRTQAGKASGKYRHHEQAHKQGATAHIGRNTMGSSKAGGTLRLS